MTDGMTGLIWLKNANCFGLKNWSAAIAAASNLEEGDCGLTDGSGPGDWRLPTKEEWETIMGQATTNGCSSPGPFVPDTHGLGCWTEGNPFSGVQSSFYWSSITREDFPVFAWNAHLNDGFIHLFRNKSLSDYVWPVRSGP